MTVARDTRWAVWSMSRTARWSAVSPLIVVAVAGAGACAGGQRPAWPTTISSSTIALEARCPLGAVWTSNGCKKLSAQMAALETGERDLQLFRAREALEHLDRARRLGPYRYDDYVRLHEQLGVANSYLERKKAALAAFEKLLALAPGYAISYTLSPKTTFLFEKARALAARRQRAQMRVSWPRGLRVDLPIPIDVEVVADPERCLSRARLFWRVDGKRTQHADFALAPAGQFRRLVLPPQVPDARRARQLSVYLAAYDERGNEVFRSATQSRPYRLPLAYQPPVRWYNRWWVWVAAGAVVALGTGVSVYAAIREPPSAVSGSFVVVDEK